MTIQVELWQALGLLGSFLGVMLAFGRLLMVQFERRLEQRFNTLERAGAEWQRLERDLLTLRADLPLQYVRREDYVRGQTVVEAKLDALAMKIENLQLREVQRD